MKKVFEIVEKRNPNPTIVIGNKGDLTLEYHRFFDKNNLSHGKWLHSCNLQSSSVRY